MKITPDLLLQAYAVGLFPMAESADDPTLHWIDPEERGVIPLQGFHVSRSLRKTVRRKIFEIRVDTAFEKVIESCAATSPSRRETWINGRIRELYIELHRRGHCHCIESWHNGTLVGGLYGVSLGKAFCGESMFSRATDASKVALVHLVARLKCGGYQLLDAQFINEHLLQFGTYKVPRAEYHQRLAAALRGTADFSAFSEDGDPNAVLEVAQA